jgi:hypothetical protein
MPETVKIDKQVVRKHLVDFLLQVFFIAEAETGYSKSLKAFVEELGYPSTLHMLKAEYESMTEGYDDPRDLPGPDFLRLVRIESLITVIEEEETVLP